jgi:hypothetical protein
MFSKVKAIAKKNLIVTSVVAVLAVVLVGAGIASAAGLYNIAGEKQTATVTVNEAIGCEATGTTIPSGIVIGVNSVTATMYPNESGNITYTLTNAGSAAIDVVPVVSVTGVTGVTAVGPVAAVTVPSVGSATFDVLVSAPHDVVPGIATITVDLGR